MEEKIRKEYNRKERLIRRAPLDRRSKIDANNIGSGLIEVESAFEIPTIGFDHYLKHKERQYPKQVLEHERSSAKKNQ